MVSGGPCVIVASGDFTILEQVVSVVGSDALDLLSSGGPTTVFAPTDDAFEDLADALDVAVFDLLALPNLADILFYHAIDGRLRAADVVGSDRLLTVNGLILFVNTSGGELVLNDTDGGGANVTATNLPATNGLVHVIDAVLIPPTIPDMLELEGGYSTLLAVAAEAEVDNDVVTGTIAEYWSATPHPPGPAQDEFTVFAPTDQAFANLLSDLGITEDDLLARADLTDILLYQTIGLGSPFDTELMMDSSGVLTLEGSTISIEEMPDGTFILDGFAKVLTTDVPAANGLIHVIDGVLVPPPPLGCSAIDSYCDCADPAMPACRPLTNGLDCGWSCECDPAVDCDCGGTEFLACMPRGCPAGFDTYCDIDSGDCEIVWEHDGCPECVCEGEDDPCTFNDVATLAHIPVDSGTFFALNFIPDQAFELVAVEFKTAADGVAEANVNVAVYPDGAGLPASTPLASGVLTAGSSTEWRSAALDSAIELDAGGSYWISFEPQGPVLLPQAEAGRENCYVSGFEFGEWIPGDAGPYHYDPWMARFVGCP